MSAVGKSRQDKIFDVVNLILMCLVIFIMVYPIYFVLVASVSEPYDVVNGRVYLWPIKPTLDAYKNVFKESRIWLGYRNSIIYTGLGTLWSLIMTVPCASVLSRKKLRGRWLLSIYFLIPMYFSGGLVPTYLQVRALGLVNKPYIRSGFIVNGNPDTRNG